jgi:hypothetical protein
MPELFGSSIILPAIVVIVLLAAVLGLVVLHRKSAESESTNNPAEAAAPVAKQTRQSRKEAALARKAAAEQEALEQATAEPAAALGVAGAETAPEAVVQATAPSDGAVAPVANAPTQTTGFAEPPLLADVPAPGKAPAATVGPSARRPERSDGLALSAFGAASIDPLQAVIGSVLRGWGDVTDEDTNRLAVFRKDKLVAALAAVEIPKDLKNSDSAKTRLAQLRRFAGSMAEHQAAHHGATEHEFAGMIVGAPAAAASTAPATSAPVTAPATAPPPRQAFSYGAEEVTPEAPVATQAESAPVVPTPASAPTPEPTAASALDRSHAFAVPEDAMESWGISSAKAEDTEAEHKAQDLWEFDSDNPADESAAEERAAEFEWGEAPQEDSPPLADLKPAAFTWGATPFDQSGSVASSVPEATTPDKQEPAAAASADDGHRSAEAAVAAAAAAFWTTPEASSMEAEAAQSPPPPTKEADPFANLGAKVSTAADIMALPASERADMLAFLEPSELSKVFAQADDKDLKKAVIDTFEHVGNTASLDALRECLEDTDPEVQLYALDAADRMLGSN